ncbi:MAG: AAA family ATPase, partial [Candidatus Aminicenantales bacterium]
GFYDLNPLQQRLVDAATSGRHAGVFFPYEATAAFGFAEPTFEWFQELGFEPVELPPERGGELWNFQRRLFAPPSGEPTAEGCVEIISAPDETAEVRALLRKVAALAREGQPLPRVGVLVRQGEVYAPLFREECVLGGLEAYHHEPPPLSRSRSGRSFLMLLDLLASDLGRAEVMDFLTYADLEVGDACPSDWDPLSLEAGVIKGAASWRSRLAALRVRLQTSGPDDEPEKAEARGVRLDHLAAFEALVEKLLALVEGVPREAGWGEMVAGTTGAFRELVRPSDERELVVEAVAELAALETTGEPAPLDVFTSLASRQLERCHAGRASFGACGPVVVGLMEGRGLPFDVVLVPGLVERAFPPPAVPDPLLPDGEREELAGLGMRLALKRERVAEELKKDELEVSDYRGRLERLEDRIREKYKTEIPGTLDVSLSPEEISLDIDRMERSLERIGPINMAVKQEFDDESERLDFLQKQRKDLLESEADLLETVRRIDRAARQQFLDIFEKIRNNFHRTFALFFEGGEGDLLLRGDDDPLESDISIQVRPPGKGSRNLRMLSSGEKALSAVALLFAIYQVKPSPFCILDEVDAPLDDHNVRKFTRVVREFSREIQFIIVTHNKLTMEAAKYLYGVTMEQSGISKIVSVKFD